MIQTLDFQVFNSQALQEGPSYIGLSFVERRTRSDSPSHYRLTYSLIDKMSFSLILKFAHFTW
uniref:Uncharacterized protein n=1 Tax=Rhizophora mucronata TaxID=61149 RepID=A0A2P2NNM7_RHIMU